MVRQATTFAGLWLSVSAVALAAGTREDFLKLIDRPRVPLAPVVLPLPSAPGLAEFRFTFASDATQRVPGILVEPESSKGAPPRAAIICLHGTGGNKEGCVPQLREFARRGFVGIAIDTPSHGERAAHETYDQAILRAYRTGRGHPFLYDTVWDVMRLIDYLETRADVDSKRVGLIGYSKGGMEAYLAAAVDTRIQATVSALGVQSFGWALDHGGWSVRTDSFKPAIKGAARDAGVWFVGADFARHFYDRVAPGIYSEFDGPSMVPLIAPRPLLAINGARDSKTPREGLMECIEAAKRAYAAAGAPEKFRFIIEDSVGHDVTPQAGQAAVDWLTRWLRR